MIYDEGCDPYEGTWAEQVARARREAQARQRSRVITNAVGYGLVAGGMLWACLRWLL
jgi:hypothetical protein